MGIASGQPLAEQFGKVRADRLQIVAPMLR
jgi:hypothetical protein